MAVQDFIPIKDVKKTVEKEEKYKPSLAERTTIETPGKPVPATSLLSQPTPKKKRARKKVQRKTPTKITPPKKDSILIITEKPQAAQKIAQALGSPKKITERGNVSYFELKKDNKTIVVASAVGHLFNLTYKAGPGPSLK